MVSTWLIIFFVHLVFSTTFITTFTVGVIINARLRQYVFICITWCLWLLGSFMFSFARVMLGLYHIFRISLNIFFFVWSSLLIRLSFWVRSFHTPRDELLYRLEKSDTYDEWFKIGARLDEICGGNKWRATEETDDYQWMYLKEYVLRLKEARKAGNLKRLVFLLRWCFDRNFASISREALYNKAFSGTKILIDDFEEEIENVIKYLAASLKSPELSLELETALGDRNVFRSDQEKKSRSSSIERMISFSKKSITCSDICVQNISYEEKESEISPYTEERVDDAQYMFFESEMEPFDTNNIVKDETSRSSSGLMYFRHEGSMMSTLFPSFSSECRMMASVTNSNEKRDAFSQTCEKCIESDDIMMDIECDCLEIDGLSSENPAWNSGWEIYKTW